MTREGDPVLRYSFLPSDRHPLILMLGETWDLRILSRALSDFSRFSAGIILNETVGFSSSDTKITLTGLSGPPGMHAISLTDKAFLWSLDAATAEYFAELVDQLAAPERKSGSEMLMCDVIGEIPIKVSRGEFTDNFLLIGERIRS